VIEMIIMMGNKLIERIKKVDELNYLSNDYKLPKKEFKNILKSYKKEFGLVIEEEIEDFILFVNGKMFFDWVIFKSINDIPVAGGNICDVGLFYSLKKGTQYDGITVMKSNRDIIKITDFLLAEASPGDFIVISFDKNDYGKIYFISHDFNEDESYRYLVAETIEDYIGSMGLKI
jgi:hypothetical protein